MMIIAIKCCVWLANSETRVVLESLLEHAVGKRTAKSQTRREVLDHLDFTEKQLQLVTVEMKDKICKMVEEVEHKVFTHPLFSFIQPIFGISFFQSNIWISKHFPRFGGINGVDF